MATFLAGVARIEGVKVEDGLEALVLWSSGGGLCPQYLVSPHTHTHTL